MRTLALAVALLTAWGLTASADDVDPEPPAGANLSKLRGKWVSVRKISGGKESAYENVSTYTFERDKVRYQWTKHDYSMKVEIDKKRPFSMTMTKENTPPKKFFFKIEKGELYLTTDRTNDPKANADFSGKSGMVFIYKREK